MKHDVAIIGCGNMGEQILKKFWQAKWSGNIYITRRSRVNGQRLARRYKAINISNTEAAQRAKIIWICVRPNNYPEVLKEIRPFIKKQIIISVAVAITQKYIKKSFPTAEVVRYMPSPLISENKGVALLVEDKKSLPQSIKELLKQCSSYIYKVNDKNMHLHTAMSSCGSAFVAAMLLNIVNIEKKVNKNMLIDVFAETLVSLKDKEPKEWRELVDFATTPGGMTAEGLKVLSSNLVQKIVRNMLNNTIKRSKKIQKDFEL